MPNLFGLNIIIGDSPQHMLMTTNKLSLTEEADSNELQRSLSVSKKRSYKMSTTDCLSYRSKNTDWKKTCLLSNKKLKVKKNKAILNKSVKPKSCRLQKINQIFLFLLN